MRLLVKTNLAEGKFSEGTDFLQFSQVYNRIISVVFNYYEEWFYLTFTFDEIKKE